MKVEEHAAGGPRPPPPWRMRASLPAWLIVMYLLQALAVIVLSTLTHSEVQKRASIAAQTARTLEAMRRSTDVVSAVKDAETGERGYLLTGDERYLEPYTTAGAALPVALSSLGDTMTEPGQARRFELLRELIGTEMATLARAVQERRAGGLAGSLAIVAKGEAPMDAVRHMTDEMRDQETARLESSLEESRAAAGVLRLLTVAGGGLLLTMFLISAVVAARAFRDRDTQSWVRAGQNLVSSSLRGEHAIDDLGGGVIRFLAEYLEAAAGTIHAVAPGGALVTCGAYALPKETNGAEKQGDGLLSQAVREQRALHICDVPETYLRVTSSLGASAPREVLVVPATAGGTTDAVVELGFFRRVGAPEEQLLALAAESIGHAFRSARYRTRQSELLEETQRQAEELQEQQEELKASNEELAEQAERLQTSQRTLEETNAQLEEQARELESQKSAILATQDLLRQKTAEIERASRYKSEFLANMSHELRTPLNSSLILAKLLVDNKQGNLTPEQVEYARSIYGAGNDLLALINDILDLAKVEAGKVEISLEPVSVPRLFDTLKRRFEPMAAERKLAFDASVEPGCPEVVETDPLRLQQVLANLLSNAVKFTEAGSVRMRAERGDGGGVTLVVKDTGIGIPADKHEVIFEAFRQADGTTNRKYGGTGLGLSICRELVTLLGGEILVRSAPSEGSTFTVRLPQRLASAATPRADPTSNGSFVRHLSPPTDVPAVSAVSSPIPCVRTRVADDRDVLVEGKRTVLVVDDDMVFAGILRDLAHELGFQCAIAPDATEGVELARRMRPVAILLDISLPDQSGLTVLELLKRDPTTRHVPIHMISVHDYEHVARELGAVGYMLKPVKRDELASAFRTIEDRLAHRVKTVLVIEDDPVQRDAIARLLVADDVETVAAATAEEGLAKLRAATFDCCVLDLMLPGVSGFELLERMSKDEACSFPPTIVYTARRLSREEEEQLRRVSASIIVKGAQSPERLLEEVTLFLHQVEAELPPDRQRMLQIARDRERVFEGRRVLLVEDDVRSVFALTRALEPKGLVVDIARNGEEALTCMRAARGVDLVLMDVMMPEMDGLSAMREIRKHSPWKMLPIIALTAKAMPDDRRACLEAGANDYIAKPIDVDKLLSLLRVWMPR